MTKLITLYKRIRNAEFKLILRSILVRVTPVWLDKLIPIPQDYSFFLIGSHGSGFHSLLYYISLCKCTPPHRGSIIMYYH